MADVLDDIEREHGEIRGLFARVSDPEADRRRALSELVRGLAAHVSVERTLVLPVVRRTGIGDRQFRDALKDDYRRMGSLLVRIERRKANSPDLPDLVTELEDTFEDHARRCRQLSELRGRLSTAELEDVSDRARNAEDVILSHPHPPALVGTAIAVHNPHRVPHEPGAGPNRVQPLVSAPDDGH